MLATTWCCLSKREKEPEFNVNMRKTVLVLLGRRQTPQLGKIESNVCRRSQLSVSREWNQ